MPERPLVSICIPTYKRYGQLKRCLESALSQDYQNIEVLVSDDTDDEPVPDWLVAMARTESKLIYIKQPVTLGMMQNDHYVRSHAKGDFLCVMHNDDEFPTNYVSKLMEILADNPSVILAGPSCARYFNGSFWYEYENYSQVGMNQFRRLADIAIRAFENPWSFEHLLYGVYRKCAVPKSFRFGYWRSIILFFYLCSVYGAIRTVGDVKIVKNTTQSDLEKYAAANYIKRCKPMKFLFSNRQEQRLTVLYRLLRFTLASEEILSLDKARLLWVILSTYCRNRFETSLSRSSGASPARKAI